MRKQGVRLTLAQAKKLGVSESVLKPLSNQLKQARASALPQRKLFESLRAIYGENIVWEQKHLVTGREFTVDMYFPDLRLGVECDGWQYHGKFKRDFVRCRQRQNAFTEQQIFLLRIPAGDIEKDLNAVVRDVMRVADSFAAATGKCLSKTFGATG